MIPLIPKFLQTEAGLTGASRGSAYHRVMELFDFTGDYDRESVWKLVSEMEKEGKISSEMAVSFFPFFFL